MLKALKTGNPRVFVVLAERAYGKVKEQAEVDFSESLAESGAGIRMKLGGSGSMADTFPDKPKGMHWHTYVGIVNVIPLYGTFGNAAQRSRCHCTVAR